MFPDSFQKSLRPLLKSKGIKNGELITCILILEQQHRLLQEHRLEGGKKQAWIQITALTSYETLDKLLTSPSLVSSSVKHMSGLGCR